MKILAKSLLGTSVLAAALMVMPAAFAAPCNGGMAQAPGAIGNNVGFESSSVNSYTGAMERNSQFTHEANQALAKDPQLKNQNIAAWVEPGGFVILRGAVDSPKDAMHAMQVVAEATGLRKFDNEMYYPGMYGPEGARNSKRAQREETSGTKEQAMNANDHNADHSWTQASSANENGNSTSAAAATNNPNNSSAANQADSESGSSSMNNSGNSQSSGATSPNKE